MVKSNAKLSYEEFNKKLNTFIGSEQLFKPSLVPIIITEGVKYFADTCECYWLLDDLTINLFRLHQQLGYLFIDIEVNKRHTVHITVREDKDMPIVYDKKIRDLCKLIPVGNYRIWLMNNVLLLPSEY